MVYRRTEQMTARLLATRASIVSAAERRVATDGWQGLTMAGVARDAGVAVGTVYRHLADKDALCVEVFARAAAREIDAVAAAAADVPSPLAACRAALETFASRALRRPRLAAALLADPAGPALEEQRLSFRSRYRELFAALLDDAVAAGEIAPVDTSLAAAVLVGGMGEGLIGPLAPARATSDGATQATITTLVDHCLRALPPPITAHPRPAEPSDPHPTPTP